MRKLNYIRIVYYTPRTHKNIYLFFYLPRDNFGNVNGTGNLTKYITQAQCKHTEVL